MNKLSLNAPAKLNLFLQVVGKRDDGYHLIESVMQSIDLCDEVELEILNNNIISLTCDDETIPTDDKNIAIKIAKKVFELKNINSGLNIHIKKSIPQGAGLGGGSADGAAVLKGINRLFSLSLSYDEMIEVGKSVGADIPFMTFGGTAIAEGIGEKLTKADDLFKCYFVIIKPDVSINTGDAYKKIDENKNFEKKDISELIDAIRDNSIEKVSNCVYNEFESIAPNEIFEIKNLLKNNGALNSIMTGSGSAVFGIFDDEEKAINAKENLGKLYSNIFICKPIKGY